MNSPQEKQERLTLRGTFNLLHFLASSHATCLTPFLRHSFGSEAFGLHGVGALAMILFCGSETHCPAMGSFLVLWLAALVIQRLRTFSLVQRSWRLHSRYGGYPWLAMRLPFVKSELQALAFEPVFCLIAGALLCELSESLGKFVMAGWLSLTIKTAIERQIERTRLRRMPDAFIEQEHFGPAFSGQPEGLLTRSEHDGRSEPTIF